MRPGKLRWTKMSCGDNEEIGQPGTDARQPQAASGSTTVPKARVAVELGMSLRSFLANEGTVTMQRELTHYVEGLADDVGLPAVQVNVRDMTEDARELEVLINGTQCRTPHERGEAANSRSSPEALAARVAQIIHLNRELLVDDRIAGDFRKSRCSESSGQCLAGLSRGDFADYLRLLLRGCFHLDCGDLLNDSMRPAILELTVQACYEEAAQLLSRLRLVLYRSPSAVSPSTLDDEPIEEILEKMREDLWFELGIRFPQVELRTDATLRNGDFRLQINDLRLPTLTGLGESEFLVNDTVAGLKLLNIEGRAASNPATGAESAIVSGGMEVKRIVRDAGLMTWGRDGYLVLACSAQLRRHAGAFIVAEGVRYDLDLLGQWYPEVITSAVTRFGLPMITLVLRSLVAEGISVRHLLGVIEAMLAVTSIVDVDWSKYIVFFPYTELPCPAMFGERLEEVDPGGFAECVRMNFRRYISHKYSRGQNTLIVYLLDPEIESRIVRSADNPLSRKERADIVKAVHDEVQSLPSSSSHRRVILTTLEVRRLFRRLIEIEFSELAVVSYQDLSPDLSIQPLARISLD